MLCFNSERLDLLEKLQGYEESFDFSTSEIILLTKVGGTPGAPGWCSGTTGDNSGGRQRLREGATQDRALRAQAAHTRAATLFCPARHPLYLAAAPNPHLTKEH